MANALHGGIQVAVARNHYKRRICVMRHGKGQHFQSVFLGHLDVAKHQIVGSFSQARNGFRTVFRLVHEVSRIFIEQDVPEDVPNRLFVFYNEDARHGHWGS